MRRKGVLKKGPEVFAMEAEQRALETEQKLIEKDNFERQKMDYTMYIFQLSRQFNDLKKQRLDMEKEYSTLLDKKATIDAESRGDEFRKAQQDALRIQDLEAKLEYVPQYWTQALREEEAYTKTLTHMQSRSAEEKHQRDIETAAFKKETANYEHDLHALLVRLQDAKNERDAAENQVSPPPFSLHLLPCLLAPSAPSAPCAVRIALLRRPSRARAEELLCWRVFGRCA
eukprot:3726143-Rhodomonas_salina.4